MPDGTPFQMSSTNWPGEDGVQQVLTLTPSKPQTLLVTSVSVNLWVPSGHGSSTAVTSSGSVDIPFGIQHLPLVFQGTYGPTDIWIGNCSVTLWVRSPGVLTFSTQRIDPAGMVLFQVGASGYYQE